MPIEATLDELKPRPQDRGGLNSFLIPMDSDILRQQCAASPQLHETGKPWRRKIFNPSQEDRVFPPSAALPNRPAQAPTFRCMKKLPMNYADSGRIWP